MGQDANEEGHSDVQPNFTQITGNQNREAWENQNVIHAEQIDVDILNASLPNGDEDEEMEEQDSEDGRNLPGLGDFLPNTSEHGISVT